MKIAIDASKVSSKNKTGVENFATSLTNKLLEISKEHTFYLITCDSKLKTEAKNAKVVYSPYKRFWTLRMLPRLINKLPVDVFFEPSTYLPGKISKKSVGVVHDLAFKVKPELYGKIDLIKQNLAVKATKSHASGLVFISKSTKDDFDRFFGEFTGPKTISYLGYDEKSFGRSITGKEVYEFNYILYVGRIEKKKNLRTAIKAYNLLRKEAKIKEKLVLAGKDGYGADKIKDFAKKSPYSDDIIFTGYVSGTSLPILYRDASLFLFPSLYEGFGIPILEAFAAKTPVVCSNTSSLPEVAGSAAALVETTNAQKMAFAMSKILNDNKYKKQLVSKGQVRASMFTWDKSAERIKKLLEEVYEK